MCHRGGVLRKGMVSPVEIGFIFFRSIGVAMKKSRGFTLVELLVVIAIYWRAGGLAFCRLSSRTRSCPFECNAQTISSSWDSGHNRESANAQVPCWILRLASGERRRIGGEQNPIGVGQ